MTAGVTFALVTGASKGLGKYFARALAARKQNLFVVARSIEKLEALTSELRDLHGILVEPIELDLSAPGAGLELAQKLRDRNIQIELLVNNAGFGERGKFWSFPLSASY